MGRALSTKEGHALCLSSVLMPPIMKKAFGLSGGQEAFYHLMLPMDLLSLEEKGRHASPLLPSLPSPSPCEHLLPNLLLSLWKGRIGLMLLYTCVCLPDYYACILSCNMKERDIFGMGGRTEKLCSLPYV